jgi:hypothetical protein
MKKNNKALKERFNYTKHDGFYLAKSVNYNMVFRAKTKAELKRKAKALLKSLISGLNETMKLENPIQLKEVSDNDLMNT